MGKLSLTGAAERGRLDVIAQMLADGADINMTNSRGHNALRGAIAEGHLETARYLLDHGAEVNSESEYRWTALYLAARDNNEPALNMLIARGANVATGLSPLLAAVEAGSVNIARAVMDAGAEVNVFDDDGRTPLYLAVERQDEAMVALLIEAGANVQLRYENRWFHETAYNAVDETILHLAAELGNIGIVKGLLAAGAAAAAQNAQGETPLKLAFDKGHAEVAGELARLLDKSIPLWKSMLSKAVENRNIQMLGHLLLSAGTEMISGCLGRSLLESALRKKRSGPKMLALLLGSGADINAPDREGKTLLHEGTDIGPKRIARLLKRGADVNARDNSGQTPLHNAACRDAEVVRSLLDAGADPDAADQHGITPLHLAASGVADRIRGMSFTIKVQVGDDDPGEDSVVEGDPNSRTSEQIVELLLMAGANVNPVAADGSSPLSLAEDQRIISLLTANGACR